MANKRRASGPARKRPAAKRSWLRRVLLLFVTLGVVGALLGALAVVILYKAIDIPNPNKEFQTQTTHVYYADKKTEIGQFAMQKRDRIDYADMPQFVKDGVVAAEDRTFWTNPGIDIKGIIRAALSNAKGGGSQQGASTITQQYVKILYLTSERSYKRKVKEAIVARKLSKQQSKDQILEGYLNTIYFGRGAYGIEAAAQTWFGVPAKDLNLRQSVALASVINNPTQFDPANGEDNADAMLNRMQRVLAGMVEMGKITRAEASEAGSELPKFHKGRATPSLGGQRGHALALVKKELLRLGVASESEIDGGGLKVYTTLSRKVMKANEDAVKEIRPDGLKELHIGSASVEPGTGALRGFYGGQDYLDSQINWALAGGQVGSTFKAYALAAGIEAGYSLKDTFDGDSPYYYNGQGTGAFAVNEETGIDHGPVNLIKATEQSINSAYADLTMSIPNGPETIIETANRLGVPENGKGGVDNLYKSPGLEPVYSVALGSATVAPVNMANAYGSFANGGQAAKLFVIDKVVGRDGEVLYKHRVKTREAISEDIAADVTYALQQVVKSGTGTAAAALGRPAAGKTGTATADSRTGGKDFTSAAWFVGYTPQLSTAVMYVRSGADGRPEALDGYLSCEFGGCYPARTWATLMRSALEGEPVESFPPPAYVDGEAPESGHAPKPTKTPTCKGDQKPSEDDCVAPKPTKTPTATASATSSATPSATPTETKHTGKPTDTATATTTTSPCVDIPPGTCPEPTDPGGPGNGGGNGDGRVAPRLYATRD
ncbi:transglycosylase domain-containing protein [Nocardioides cavernaquae]|uniref:transglycosylase domain-containing protein n=1 Tax=Nocardioides cavernaquae TaxID=2321396 RepID=UPI0011C37C9D|nr:transglycosylase domain-containing protein [Nocardioides cavernaquae]